MRLAETLPSDLNGAIARVEARYWAGDLAGALATARPALEIWPQEPQLLLLGSELALQLLLPAEALRWSELLVGLDGSQLDPEVVAFYRDRGTPRRGGADQCGPGAKARALTPVTLWSLLSVCSPASGRPYAGASPEPPNV